MGPPPKFHGTRDILVRGCDMRNRILARDLTDVTYRPGTRRCVVARGTLHDPYTGTAMPFVKGDGTSDDVQVDHV